MLAKAFDLDRDAPWERAVHHQALRDGNLAGRVGAERGGHAPVLHAASERVPGRSAGGRPEESHLGHK